MQKKKDSSLVTISIITVVTLFIWISIEGFQRFNKKDLKTVPEEILNPLTPTLDKGVFDTLKSRISLTQEELSILRPKYLKESSSTSPELPTPTPETAPKIATESAQLLQ